jgi:hypothetical protein
MPDRASSLLTYRTSTDPSPIQASTPQVAAQGRVNISASATDPVYCNQIEVSVPVGVASTDLFASTPSASASTNKWAVTTVLRMGRELGLDTGVVYASFTYDCVSPTDYRIDYDLVFGAFGAVNEVSGDCAVLIRENSGTTNDPATFTSKTSTVTISKVSPRLYVDNFVATAPPTPTVPTTDFPAGAAINFAWESNGTYFQIFAKGQTTPVYAGTNTRFSRPAGVTSDTTFVLVASVTGNPGQDTPQGGYQPIYLYKSLTVTVSNPVLTPSSISVSGGLTVDGSTTLAGATVNSSLGVNGTTTLSHATVNNNLTVNGLSMLSDVAVGSSFTALRGVVSMHRPGRLVYSGTDFQSGAIFAQTDGFAVAQVLAPSGGNKSCFAWASIYTDPAWFQVLGGTVTSSNLLSSNMNSMCLPIQASSYWYCQGQNAVGAAVKSQVQIYWFPVGGAAATEKTFRVLSEAETKALPAPPPPPAVVEPARILEERSAAANEFIERLEAVFDRSLPADSRAELAELLTKV